MEAFLISASSLLLAEMGDKTQLMALVLAARFRRPVTVMTAIVISTVALNGMAVAVGAVVGDVLGPTILRWGLGLSFLGAAAWALLASDEPEAEADVRSRYGVFVTAFTAFSLAELGDKTQFTTAALAMKFPWIGVALGSSIGMTLAILPAVMFGDRVCRLVPMRTVRWASGLLFAGLGVATLAGWL